jgi:TolB-like protein/tetratricopeptide (TPR) repeat protein
VPGAKAGGAQRRSHKRAAFAAGAVTTLAIAGLIIGTAVGGDAPEIHRLAVLPLSNLTGDPQQDYFVAGMHDALVTELAQIGALMVTSRQSVLRYEGSDRPMPEIARELGVDALVEGSVFRAGDSVRITVQLVRAEPEEHLWTGTYLGALHDALALQGNVARGLASAVHARVGPEEWSRLSSRRAVDPAAQEAYLQGLYLVQKFATTLVPVVSTDTLQAAIRYLEEAVALDPEWAAAHAKLAKAYHYLASAGDHADEFYPKSKAAALRALELDETEAQAHAALGYVLFAHERDWAGAEREILRAMELDPSSYDWSYAHYLQYEGRHEEAITHFHKAEERDPLSTVLKEQVAYAYRCAGRHEEAIAQLDELEARMGSDGLGLGQEIGYEYSAMSKHDEAIAELEGAVARSDSLPQALAMLAYVYARAGRNDEARRLLSRLEGRSGKWWAPELYAALGETDRAVASLGAALEGKPHRIGGVKCLPAYQALRDDPRIQEVVRRFGYAP